jgi:Phosphotransferase enzyme family.
MARGEQNPQVTNESTIEEAIKHLELFKDRDVNLSPLSGGSMNGVFLAQMGDERYVIRKPGSKSDVLGMDRLSERYNAEIAAETGVAPRIIEYLDGSDVMVLEHIEGTVPVAEDLHSPEQVRRMADSCSRLHAGSRFINDFDMYRKVENWLHVCNERAIPLPDGFNERMALVSEAARSLGARAMPTVPCHNDLAPYNFIDDGHQLWIIDFEFSGNNDPCNDLGGLASEAELSEELRVLLCEEYFGEATPRLLARMTLHNLVAMVGWMLFCAIHSYSEGVALYWSAAIDGLDSEELPTLLRDAL